jgi:serine/threonine protein kinase
MDSKHYGFPSDIWSIGMTVFEMITGSYAYPEVTNFIILHEMIRSKPSPSLAGIHNVSLEAVDFVNRW